MKLFHRAGGTSDGEEESVEEAVTSPVPMSRKKRSRRNQSDEDEEGSSIFKLPPLSWMFITIVLIITTTILHMSMLGNNLDNPEVHQAHIEKLKQYNSQLENQIKHLSVIQAEEENKKLLESSTQPKTSAVQKEISAFKSFVSKEVETVSSMFSVNNISIDIAQIEESLMGTNNLNMTLWEDRLVQKLICLQHGSGGLYLYHARKAAGTTLRDVLAIKSGEWKVKLYETEGISLNKRFIEDPNLFSIVTLRDPVKRVMSLYWYEHVGWFHGVLHEINKIKSLEEWFNGWKDGSKWKTDFVKKNPGTVYVEIENYYVKMLTGWQGDTPIGERDFELAKRILESFDMTFLVEWMQDDTQVTALNTLFPGRSTISPGQKVKGDANIRVKLTKQFAANEAAISKELERINQYDIMLYDFAQSLMARRLKSIVSLVKKAEQLGKHWAYRHTCSKGRYIIPPDLQRYIGVFRPVGHKGPF